MRIDGEALVKIAHLVKLPDVQRLAYLLGAVGECELAAPLAEWLKSRNPRVVPLLPLESGEAEIDDRWRIRPFASADVAYGPAVEGEVAFMELPGDPWKGLAR